jgi:hypothetical protein
LHLVSRSAFQAIMLGLHDTSLGYVPSNLDVALHLAVAAAFLYGTWLALVRADV